MSKLHKWFENFWYYHKWHAICWFLVILAFIVAVAQCASIKKYDYNILIFTYTEFMDEQKEKMSEYISAYGEDIDGDGKVTVGFIDCSYNKSNTPTQVVEARISRLQSTLIAEPDTVIFLTDSNSFEYLNNLFEVELFADIGLSSDNGKSVMFSDDFYNKTVVFDNATLPQGLRLSRRARSENITHSQEILDAADNMLKKLDNN